MPSIASRRHARSLAAAGLAVLAAGCSTLGNGAVTSDYASPSITPGMTRQEVESRLGRPTWVFGVRQENLTILNYRLNHADCTIYQVSVRPDGTVRDAATAWDPACDGPAGRD